MKEEVIIKEDNGSWINERKPGGIAISDD